MIVKDIMMKNVIKINKKEKASEIRKKMMMYNVKTVVVTEKGSIKGIVTNNEIIKTLDLSETASAIMDRDFITVKEGDTVQEAAATLLENNMLSLPVVDTEGQLAGLITETDIVKDMAINSKKTQPRLSQERLTIYLAMTEDREREEYWLERCQQYSLPCATTQVGANAEKLAVKMRESSIVAAIARNVINEDPREKIAVSNAVKDVYAQINLINPGLGGGFKLAITRGNGIVVAAAYGRCGHSLANGPQVLNTGYSII
ncbi:MAG: HutP family protein [Candidatus Muiribacteriota bacterium]